MWANAEIVSLVDEEGVIRAVSRNESEDPIYEAVGVDILYRVTPETLPQAQEALAKARAGEECQVLVAAEADACYVYWSRAVV